MDMLRRAAVLLTISTCAALACNSSEWTKLIEKGDLAAARKLCEGMVKRSDSKQVAEGHKCLANLALQGQDIIFVEKDGAGGIMRGGFKPEAVDRALEHLTAGIAADPSQLCMHQGRMHISLEARRYGDMEANLRLALAHDKSAERAEHWLAYAPYFDIESTYDAAVRYHKVLDEEFDDPRITANIGAFLLKQSKDQEGAPYVKAAAEATPKDPINWWNYAILLDVLKDPVAAHTAFRHALEIRDEPNDGFGETGGDGLGPDADCLYANFLKRAFPDDAERERYEKACAASAKPKR